MKYKITDNDLGFDTNDDREIHAIALNALELATLLAALAEWTVVLEENGGVPDDAGDQFASVQPLTVDGCIALRQRLSDAKPIRVVAFVEGVVVQAARASAMIDFSVLDIDDLKAASADKYEMIDERIDAAEEKYEALEFGVY